MVVVVVALGNVVDVVVTVVEVVVARGSVDVVEEVVVVDVVC